MTGVRGALLTPPSGNILFFLSCGPSDALVSLSLERWWLWSPSGRPIPPFQPWNFTAHFLDARYTRRVSLLFRLLLVLMVFGGQDGTATPTSPQAQAIAQLVQQTFRQCGQRVSLSTPLSLAALDILHHYSQDQVLARQQPSTPGPRNRADERSCFATHGADLNRWSAEL